MYQYPSFARWAVIDRETSSQESRLYLSSKMSSRYLRRRLGKVSVACPRLHQAECFAIIRSNRARIWSKKQMFRSFPHERAVGTQRAGTYRHLGPACPPRSRGDHRWLHEA